MAQKALDESRVEMVLSINKRRSYEQRGLEVEVHDSSEECIIHVSGPGHPLDMSDLSEHLRALMVSPDDGEAICEKVRRIVERDVLKSVLFE